MKKLFLSIIFIGALIFVAGNVLAAPLPPVPGMCDMDFTDSGGETKDGDAWCTSCPDGPYDFCVGDTHYQFGCVKSGWGCSCDENNTFAETCSGGCDPWDCAPDGGGCAWGSCDTTLPEEEEEEESSGSSGARTGGTSPDEKGYTGSLKPPIEAKSFEELINGIINFVFWIGVAVAPILIIIAGIMFMTAGGDTMKIGKAKNLILYTVIGFAIILFAKGLIAVLESVLGVAD